MRIGEANDAFFDVSWWFFVSEFVHMTESPASIVIAAGTKPAFVMLTVFVAANAVGEASRNAASTGSRRNLFMLDCPPRETFE